MLHCKPFAALRTPELYEILRVRAAVFVVEQNCVYQDPDGTDPESWHVYTEENGTITAYLRVFLRDPQTAQIGRVLTMRRGQGLGREVMEAGIRTAICELHAGKIYLEAQTYAVGFYEKLGFSVISAEFLEDGIPHVQMLRNCEVDT